MIHANEILQTIAMIDQQNLDIRTITMGISLRDCADPDIGACCGKIYDKITRLARDLVKTGEDIENEFGIPIVNKRISVTPIALVAESCATEDYAAIAKALDEAAKSVGVNFIGGFPLWCTRALPWATAAFWILSRRRCPQQSASAPASTSPPPRPASTWTPRR